ncbi:MAG: SufB/SufD family protein [Acidimicrobiales bacterium]
MPLPSEKEEVWRYTPIDRLDLDRYRPVGVTTPPAPTGAGGFADAFVDGVAADLSERSALVVVSNGTVVALRPGGAAGTTAAGLPAGLTVGSLTGAAGPGDDVATAGRDLLGSVLDGGDALVRLNDALHADAVVVDVAAGTVLDAPVVVVHWCDGAERPAGTAPASFPRTLCRVGRGARAAVVEVVAGAPGDAAALVVPVTELVVEDGALLDHVALQVLGTGSWHLARTAARVGRDGSLRSFSAGLGGAYDRNRTDAAIVGQGGATQLRTAYFGSGDQVHDIRTLQDHEAPHTTSDLLCKGAVAGASRSVYSGLIRVRRGAVRTEAMQTNHNLVLDERAHADSVPNLDIEENDVRCSHASTVGPVDEDQRYYLESRGIPPERAERLIVLGFFDDIVRRAPVAAAVARLRREVGTRLAGALGIDDELVAAAAGGEDDDPGDDGERRG